MEQYEFYLRMLDYSIQNIENLSKGKNIPIEEFKDYLKIDINRVKHYYEELKKELTTINTCLAK